MEENYNDILNNAIDFTESGQGPLGPDFAGTFLESWLYPGLVREREFGQQASLQKMQNEWNSEENKMSRLIKAGVNPLTAAQGVAGDGQSGATGITASQPSSGTLPEAVQSVGDVVDKLSAAHERNSLLENRNKNIATDTYLKLMQAGYQEALAKNLSIATLYLPAEKVLNLMSMASQVKKINAEYQSILQGVEESKARIKEIDADIELAKAQRDYTRQLELESQKRTYQIEVSTAIDNWRLGKMQKLNLDPNNPIEYNMFMNACEGNFDMVEKGAAVFRDVEYGKASGQYEAEEEHSYNIAYNKALGDAYASWLRRPSNIVESLQQDIFVIKKMRADNKISQEEAESRVKQSKEFNDGFKSFKNDLLKDMQQKNADYRKKASKYGRNSNIARDAKYAANKATAIYHNFDEDDYVDLLLNSSGH